MKKKESNVRVEGTVDAFRTPAAPDVGNQAEVTSCVCDGKIVGSPH